MFSSPDKGSRIQIDSDDESPDNRRKIITEYVSFVDCESDDAHWESDASCPTAEVTRRLSFKSSRIRLRTRRICRWYIISTCLLYLVLCVAAWLIVPTLMAPHFLRGITIDVRDATFRMTADGPRLLDPKAHVFMNKSFMGFIPFISYKAQVQPFKAHLYMRLDDGSPKSLRLSDTGSHQSGQLLTLGQIHVTQPVSLDSQHDFNETLGAEVEITASSAEMAVAAHNFLLRKHVTATTRAYVQIACLIGGFLPFYLPITYIEYEMMFPAFNKFQDQPVDLGDLTKVHGEPGVLHITAGASIYNPTPISIELEEPLNLRVDYPLNGTDYTIGLLDLPRTKVVPGFNNLTAKLAVTQNDVNIRAIENLLSTYVSDGDDGTPPQIQVWLRPAGSATSDSEIIRQSVSLVELPILIGSSKKKFIQAVTSDITFVGSLVSMAPEPYHVTVNMDIKSPVPQWIKVTKMHMIAYKDDINGYEMYNVKRDLDPSKYTIPPSAAHSWQSVPLQFSEVHMHMGMEELYYACQSSATRTLNVGVRGRFDIMIMPGGFLQQVHYVQRQVNAVMCYHVAPPPWKCGMNTYIAWAEMPGNRSGEAVPENIQPVLS